RLALATRSRLEGCAVMIARIHRRSVHAMRIVITGGAGFLGMRLARKLLERGTLTDTRGQKRDIRSLVLLDIVAPLAAVGDPRVASIGGDLADPAVIERSITQDTEAVFHLSAVMR